MAILCLPFNWILHGQAWPSWNWTRRDAPMSICLAPSSVLVRPLDPLGKQLSKNWPLAYQTLKKFSRQTEISFTKFTSYSSVIYLVNLLVLLIPWLVLVLSDVGQDSFCCRIVPFGQMWLEKNFRLRYMFVSNVLTLTVWHLAVVCVEGAGKQTLDIWAENKMKISTTSKICKYIAS